MAGARQYPNPTVLSGISGGGGVGRPDFSVAYGVNIHEQVVGLSDAPFSVNNPNSTQGVQHGFIWQTGVFTDLTPIASAHDFDSAEGINDSGEVVGYTDTISRITGATLQRAFVYIAGTMYNLTFFEVDGPTVLLSDAFAIDCQGNIAAVGTPPPAARFTTTYWSAKAPLAPARSKSPSGAPPAGRESS